MPDTGRPSNFDEYCKSQEPSTPTMGHVSMVPATRSLSASPATGQNLPVSVVHASVLGHIETRLLAMGSSRNSTVHLGIKKPKLNTSGSQWQPGDSLSPSAARSPPLLLELALATGAAVWDSWRTPIGMAAPVLSSQGHTLFLDSSLNSASNATQPFVPYHIARMTDARENTSSAVKKRPAQSTSSVIKRPAQSNTQASRKNGMQARTTRTLKQLSQDAEALPVVGELAVLPSRRTLLRSPATKKLYMGLE